MTTLMPQFGQNNAAFQEIISAGTKFYSKCYGFPATSMTKCRQLVWAKRAGNRSLTVAPTNEAAIENMSRSHLTVMICKETMSPDPIWIRARETWWHAHSTHCGDRCVTCPWISFAAHKMWMQFKSHLQDNDLYVLSGSIFCFCSVIVAEL